MGLSYEIHREVAVLTATGRTTFEDLLAALGTLKENNDFRSGMKILIDCRDSTFKPTPGEVRDAASVLGSFFGSRSPIAYVAPTSLNFALGRMLEVYCESEGVVFQAFRKYEDAENWLDTV